MLLEKNEPETLKTCERGHSRPHKRCGQFSQKTKYLRLPAATFLRELPLIQNVLLPWISSCHSSSTTLRIGHLSPVLSSNKATRHSLRIRCVSSKSPPDPFTDRFCNLSQTHANGSGIARGLIYTKSGASRQPGNCCLASRSNDPVGKPAWATAISILLNETATLSQIDPTSFTRLY